MKLSAPAQCTLYRAFTPRWAAEPLSGAGAARSGGRFNRFGQPALYLSLHLDTAAAEYAQAASFLPPFTLVSYRADLPALADVRLLDASWDALWADWTDDWRKALVNKVEPVSWVLGDLLREAAIPGVIFASMAQPGGVNVALFLDMLQPEQVLHVLDDGRLPRDGRSWADPAAEHSPE
ncbi:RES family NAD+ phosphorylase [Xanthomonas sp. fls2-241-TYG-148]|uniref:RES family NAD+ phosphorylase n=1 Tax=Xanthomonas sp. fls2-241-TYG-148 TaxID=3040328 RepID=UPI002554092D|nr:RES family NAD+ phosphorylase [Xanthomonas sp. fls2-241-TYG-148]